MKDSCGNAGNVPRYSKGFIVRVYGMYSKVG
jgi:hypothetical protein